MHSIPDYSVRHLLKLLAYIAYGGETPESHKIKTTEIEQLRNVLKSYNRNIVYRAFMIAIERTVLRDDR